MGLSSRLVLYNLLLFRLTNRFYLLEYLVPQYWFRRCSTTQWVWNVSCTDLCAIVEYHMPLLYVSIVEYHMPLLYVYRSVDRGYYISTLFCSRPVPRFSSWNSLAL